MPRTKYTYDPTKKDWHTSVWDGTYNIDGSKHRKYIRSTKSSADLEKKVNEFRRQVEHEGAAKSAPVTFGVYAQRWLAISKSSKEKNTQNMYRYTLNYFSSINHKFLSDINHSDFQSIINENIDKPRTCRTIKLTFSQIIKSAVRDHLLPKSVIDDILSDISLPKYQKPLKRALNELEKQAMKDADLDERKRAFISLLYYCGLRRGEALALTPDDFNWNDNTVSISKVIIYDSNKPLLKAYPKSDNGIRIIPLPDDSVKHIKPFVSSCSDSFLFHAENNDMMTAIGYRRMWESIICSMNIALGYDPQQKKKRIEKPIQGLTAHAFRHNYCTELCYKVPAISTKMIAKLLGDTEKMVLDVYSHIMENKENVKGVLNDVF